MLKAVGRILAVFLLLTLPRFDEGSGKAGLRRRSLARHSSQRCASAHGGFEASEAGGGGEGEHPATRVSARWSFSLSIQARSAGPAWLLLAEAFAWGQERARWLIKFGAFYRQVNDMSDKARRVTDPQAQVQVGDHLLVYPEPKMFPGFQGVDWEARVVLETEDIMLVNKPPAPSDEDRIAEQRYVPALFRFLWAGVPCHYTVDNVEQNLLSALRRIRPGLELLLPHRLDADTGGLIIVAKHREALSAINVVMRRPGETLVVGNQDQDHQSAFGGDARGGGTMQSPAYVRGSSSMCNGHRNTAVAPAATPEAGCLRKRYRALVEVLPGYPPLHPGPLTHYTRRSTWAPKEFRREISTGDEAKPTTGSREPEAPTADGFEMVSSTAIDVGDIRDDTTGQTWQACRLIVLSVRSVGSESCPDVSCAPRFIPSGSPETAGEMGTSSSRKSKGLFGNTRNEVSVPPSITDDAVLYGEIGVGPDGAGGTPPQGLGGSQTRTRVLGEASNGVDGLEYPITILEGCSARGSRIVRCFREVEVELVTGRSHQIRGQLAAEGCPIVGDRLYRRLQDRPPFTSPSEHGEGHVELVPRMPDCGGIHIAGDGIGYGDDKGATPTISGAMGDLRARSGDAEQSHVRRDVHEVTRAPGNFVDSPYLALQACELSLEFEGQAYEARLPPESCWWAVHKLEAGKERILWTTGGLIE